MKIKNKYLRNRAFREKHWNRIRNTEHPFETYCPYSNITNELAKKNQDSKYFWDISAEGQVKRHFDWIDTRARYIENGSHRHWNHASSTFRRAWQQRVKAKERAAIQKIRNGQYDIEVPISKKDVDYYYF